MQRVLLSLLALGLPPLAAWLARRAPAPSLAVLVVWAAGLLVFFGFMSGPGALLVLLAIALAWREIWRRR
jgi:hypothetical protein